MPDWSPEQWNSVGVVGLVVIMGGLFYLSLIREWIVPGHYYRRIEKRADKDAESVATLSRALAESTDNNAATVKVLESLRETMERR